jgi:hypothetical protein
MCVCVCVGGWVGGWVGVCVCVVVVPIMLIHIMCIGIQTRCYIENILYMFCIYIYI